MGILRYISICNVIYKDLKRSILLVKYNIHQASSMYITCPECKSSFVVTPEQLGVSGRKVKCSKCKNIWHAQPQEDLQENVKIEPTITESDTPVLSTSEIGVNLPALLPINLPSYLCITPVFLVALIIFILVMCYSDSLGLTSNSNEYSGITINDVNITHKKDAHKIIMQYKVMNTSEKKVIIPLVRIRLFDNEHRVLQTHVESAAVQLNPKQYVSIRTEFTSIPPIAKSIDITLGNKLDFLLR